jgi:CBS domain containing-hemolysin-like protein
VCDYYQHQVGRVPEDYPLRTMLEDFKKGDYHMALVEREVKSTAEAELVGLVTLEVWLILWNNFMNKVLKF